MVNNQDITHKDIESLMDLDISVEVKMSTNSIISSLSGDQNVSTSYEGNKEINNVVLGKGQTFTDGEYKQIMDFYTEMR